MKNEPVESQPVSAGAEPPMSAEEFWARDECGEFRKNRFKKMNRWKFAEAYAEYRAQSLPAQTVNQEMLAALKLASPYVEFYAKREMASPSNGEEAVRDTRDMLRTFRAAIARAESELKKENVNDNQV